MQVSKLALAALLALAAPAALAAPTAAKEKGVRTVPVTVTKEGFSPARITVKPGETVKLAVTREVERTCATDIVMKDLGVNEPLPLGKTVVVTVKPEKKGTYRYACAHGHVAGDLVVQ